MKLYTEEQVRMAIMVLCELNSLKENVIMDSLTPIELPSDDEIEDMSKFEYYDEEQRGFITGAKFIKEQILNQNK
jgi:hypothetical protein